MALLEVRNLRVEFPTRRGVLTAVDDVSFSIDEGEVLGVVGESGAGKSITGTAIIRLIESSRPAASRAGRSSSAGGGSTTFRPRKCAMSAASRSARSSRTR